MGSNRAEGVSHSYEATRPEHQVTVDGFYMGRFEGHSGIQLQRSGGNLMDLETVPVDGPVRQFVEGENRFHGRRFGQEHAQNLSRLTLHPEFHDIGQAAEMILVHVGNEHSLEVVQRETTPDQQAQHRSSRIDQDPAVTGDFQQGRSIEPFVSGIPVRGPQRNDFDWLIQNTELP